MHGLTLLGEIVGLMKKAGSSNVRTVSFSMMLPILKLAAI